MSSRPYCLKAPFSGDSNGMPKPSPTASLEGNPIAGAKALTTSFCATSRSSANCKTFCSRSSGNLLSDCRIQEPVTIRRPSLWAALKCPSMACGLPWCSCLARKSPISASAVLTSVLCSLSFVKSSQAKPWCLRLSIVALTAAGSALRRFWSFTSAGSGATGGFADPKGLKSRENPPESAPDGPDIWDMSAIKLSTLMLWPVPWTFWTLDVAFCPTSKVFSMAFLIVPVARPWRSGLEKSAVTTSHFIYVNRCYTYFNIFHSSEYFKICWISIVASVFHLQSLQYEKPVHHESWWIIVYRLRMLNFLKKTRKENAFLLSLRYLNCTSCEAACRQLLDWNSKEWSLTVCILVCQEHHEIIHNHIQSIGFYRFWNIQWVYKLSSSAGIAIQPCAESNLATARGKHQAIEHQSASSCSFHEITWDNHRSWAAL